MSQDTCWNHDVFNPIQGVVGDFAVNRALGSYLTPSSPGLLPQSGEGRGEYALRLKVGEGRADCVQQ